jgi:hypothetical protein
MPQSLFGGGAEEKLTPDVPNTFSLGVYTYGTRV